MTSGRPVSSRGTSRWIGIAVGVILLLLILGWLSGLFADDEVGAVVVPDGGGPVVVAD